MDAAASQQPPLCTSCVEWYRRRGISWIVGPFDAISIAQLHNKPRSIYPTTSKDGIQRISTHNWKKKKQYILACHSHRVHLCNVLGLNILSNFLWLYFQSYKDGQISGHLMIFQKVNIWFCLGHTIFQPWYCLQMKKNPLFIWPRSDHYLALSVTPYYLGTPWNEWNNPSQA